MDQNLQSQIDLAVRSLDNELAREILVKESRDGTSNLSRLDFLRLNFLRMNTLSTDRLLVILNESLIIPFSIPDFNFENRIVDYVELLDYIPEQMDFMVKLKNTTENHNELLGAKNILVDGKPSSPKIGNWIKDYTDSIADQDQNALGEMRYVNTNPNSRQLTTDERAILQKIFRLYDKLNEYVLLWENLPENLPQEELDKFGDYANNMYFKSVEDEDSEEVLEKDLDLAPKPTAQKQSPLMEQPSTTTSITSPYTIPLQKDLDLSAQPKKGLVFDIPTNVDLDQEVEERKKRAKQQEQLTKIQAKLDDLKNRKKNN